MALAASSSALARALLLRGPGRAWGTGLQARCGGGGGPVNLARPAAAELAEQDELTWEDGTAQPEPCLDEFNLLTTNQAVGMLAAGFAGYAALGFVTKVSNKEARVPYTPKEVYHQPKY